MSPSERLRLFVAVDVPQEHLSRIEELTADVGGSLRSARWTPIQNQHITLKFLGATAPELVVDVVKVCTEVVRAYRPFQVWLSGLGAFPNSRRARVLWLGIEDPYQGLEGMAGDLDRRLEPLGFAVEKRAYTPHVTLARFKTGERLQDPLPQLLTDDLEPIWVDRVSLYRSRVSSAGAVYESLESFALA